MRSVTPCPHTHAPLRLRDDLGQFFISPSSILIVYDKDIATPLIMWFSGHLVTWGGKTPAGLGCTVAEWVCARRERGSTCTLN